MSKPSGIITLLTDFGLSDPFVGVMHGVILARNSNLKIVDLTHGIQPQDINQAAFWIAASYRDFPKATVHVVVVDPGVGSNRRPIIAQLDEHYFVAPDNGVLDLAIKEAEFVEVRTLELEVLNPQRMSKTFHGRDVFSPAGAQLASGQLAFDALGQVIDDFERLDFPRVQQQDGVIRGQIFMSDHFGNLFSNIPSHLYQGFKTPQIRVGNLTLPLKNTYADVLVGEPIALTNAFDRLEIAVRDGDARVQLGLRVGQVVEIKGK